MKTADAVMLTTSENDMWGDFLSIDEMKQRDIDSMRCPNEPSSSWKRRRLFLEVHWDNYSMKELSTLSNAFINVLTLGCEYSPGMMLKLNSMAMPVAMAAEKKRGGNPSAIHQYWLHEKLQKKVYQLQKCCQRKLTTKEELSSISFQGLVDSSDEDFMSISNKEGKNLTNVKRAAQSRVSSHKGDTTVEGNQGDEMRNDDTMHCKSIHRNSTTNGNDIVSVAKALHPGKSRKQESRSSDTVSKITEVHFGKSEKHGRKIEMNLQRNQSVFGKREIHSMKCEGHARNLKVQSHSVLKTREKCSERNSNTEEKSVLKKVTSVQKGDNSSSKTDVCGITGGQKSNQTQTSIETIRDLETESDKRLGDMGKFKAIYVGGYGGYRHSVDYTKLLRKVRAKQEEQKSKAIKDLQSAKQQLQSLEQSADKRTGSDMETFQQQEGDLHCNKQLGVVTHSERHLGIIRPSDRQIKIEKQGTTYEKGIRYNRSTEKVTSPETDGMSKGSRSSIYVTNCVKDLKVFMDIKKKMESTTMANCTDTVSDEGKRLARFEPRNCLSIPEGHCAQCQSCGPKTELDVHNSPIKKMQTAVGKGNTVPNELRITVKSRHDFSSDQQGPFHGKTLLPTDKSICDSDIDHQEACHGKRSVAVAGVVQDQLNFSGKMVDSSKSELSLSPDEQTEVRRHKDIKTSCRQQRRCYTKQKTELFARKPVEGVANSTYLFIPTQVYRAKSKKLAPLRSS